MIGLYENQDQVNHSRFDRVRCGPYADRFAVPLLVLQMETVGVDRFDPFAPDVNQSNVSPGPSQ